MIFSVTNTRTLYYVFYIRMITESRGSYVMRKVVRGSR